MFPAAGPVLSVLGLAGARPGPRGAHCCLEILHNNSPEFWRLFVEGKAKERRENTSNPDLIAYRGSPNPTQTKCLWFLLPESLR